MATRLNWEKNKSNKRGKDAVNSEYFDKYFKIKELDAEIKKLNDRLNEVLSSGQSLDEFGIDYNFYVGYSPIEEENKKVRCLHCGQRYDLHEMVFEYRHFNGNFNGIPLWWCKHKACNGAGYGIDIYNSYATDEEIKTAKKQGYQDCKMGCSVDDNPCNGRELEPAWEDGWLLCAKRLGLFRRI